MKKDGPGQPRPSLSGRGTEFMGVRDPSKGAKTAGYDAVAAMMAEGKAEAICIFDN